MKLRYVWRFTTAKIIDQIPIGISILGHFNQYMTRYSVRKFLDALSNPKLFSGEFNHIGQKLNQMYYRNIGLPDESINVIDEEWDNLIIFDAARYDSFKKLCKMPGELEYRYSSGSTSAEFLRNNFQQQPCYDTVYVSANPNVHIVDDMFHDVINLYENKFNQEYGVTLPQDVVDEAIRAEKKYPKKRLIIHFMQPHNPYIGEFGQTIYNTGLRDNLSDSDIRFFPGLKYGRHDFDLDAVWRAYRENLEIVLEKSERLLKRLTGKCVVTADHGELLGDRLSPIPAKGFAHPPNLYVKELIKVPWLQYPAKKRKTTETDPPVYDQGPTKELVKSRLRDLGYKT